MQAKDFTVGQELYFVPSNRGPHTHVTITKVGRVWIQLSNGYRCDFNLKVESEYVKPPTCYFKEEIYNKELELSNAWRNFTSKLQGRKPENVSIDKIEACMKILF